MTPPPSKRDVQDRLDRAASPPPPTTSGEDGKSTPWGQYPDAPERREAMACARAIMRAGSHVPEASLPTDQTKRHHARLALIHDRFPEAIKSRTDADIVAVSRAVIAQDPVALDLPHVLFGVIPDVPSIWSEDAAVAYSEYVADGDSEAAYALLVREAYAYLARNNDPIIEECGGR
jgi:hypothetical protein